MSDHTDETPPSLIWDFTYTFDDYRIAMRMHRRRVLRPRRLLIAALLILLWLIALSQILQPSSPPAPGPKDSPLWAILPWAVIAVLVPAFIWWAARRAVRLGWRKQLSMLTPHRRIVVSDAGVWNQTDAIRTEYRWTAFTRDAVHPRMILLYPSDLSFLMLPTRIMTPAQVEQLKRLLAAHVRPNVPGAFPVQMAGPSSAPPGPA